MDEDEEHALTTIALLPTEILASMDFLMYFEVLNDLARRYGYGTYIIFMYQAKKLLWSLITNNVFFSREAFRLVRVGEQYAEACVTRHIVGAYKSP